MNKKVGKQSWLSTLFSFFLSLSHPKNPFIFKDLGYHIDLTATLNKATLAIK
jgi:hypothetical protein